MTAVFIVVSLVAGGCAYVVGSAFVAPRDSVLRATTGGILLAGCVLGALLLPPTIAGFSVGGVGAGLYAMWIVFVVAGLLAGMRIWRLAQPGASLFAIDDSPIGRAASQLMVAGSLDEALEIMRREKVVARDLPALAEPLRKIGSHYFFQLPQSNREVYALVSQYVPPAMAAEVADRILEGAARKR